MLPVLGTDCVPSPSLYVVGSGSKETFVYNFTSMAWSATTAASRPFTGDHHAMVRVGRELYILGGLGGHSGGLVSAHSNAAAWQRRKSPRCAQRRL